MNSNITNTNTSEKIRKLCALALFTALAYASVLISPIKVNFLTFDCKDAVMCIGAMFYGPVSGVVMSLLTALVEMVTVSTTGPWGMLMNFISSTVFVLAASLIYKYKRNMTGAVIGLIASALATTAVMMPANLIITPLYMGVSSSDVAKLIPSLLLPFNFIKASLNASLVLILYKPITTALKKTGLVKNHVSPKMSKKTTLAVTLAAVAIAALCIAVFIIFMDAKISFGK